MALIVAISLVALLGFAALAIELGAWYQNQGLAYRRTSRPCSADSNRLTLAADFSGANTPACTQNRLRRGLVDPHDLAQLHAHGQRTPHKRIRGRPL